MAATPAQHSDGGISPSSSPRLPSPPPFTEVQFGPKSPSVSGAVAEFSLDNKPDDGAHRRIRPGTKAADMGKGPPFLPLHQLESAFQLQEYLKSLHAKLTRDDATTNISSIDKAIASQLVTPPTAQDTGEPVDRNLWLYELCRFLCSKTTRLIVAFFGDTPPCSAQTCPEMRASEWQYLCAVHEPPKSCSAIDYCNHTLDWASNILSSTKHFPSRLSLGGEGGNSYQSMRQLTNIFRRVYRIYAHAWFQHREVFWNIEAELGLYTLFKAVCDQYQLIPEDNYTIPPEAEGGVNDKLAPVTHSSPEKPSNVSILSKNEDQTEESGEDQSTNTLGTGATTRRHRHTPSTGVPVAVIAEGQEDEDEETTMLDIGGPGPAQDIESSLSPPKPRVERAKSPGLIEIPDNTDPERAPEDPTPVAVYELNPFGSPGPAEVEGAVEKEPAPTTDAAGEAVSDKHATDDDKEAPETEIASGETTRLPAEAETSAETSVEAPLSNDEPKVVVEDPKDEEKKIEEDESMGKIDIGEIKEEPKTDEADDAEKAEVKK